MPTPPDVLVPNVQDLFWKKVRQSGWLYNGPVVFTAPDHYSKELRQKIGNVVGCVSDDLSTLWVFCWMDAFTDDEKVTVRDDLCSLPLRFRGQVYEEGVNRAKSHLVDRLFPDLRPEDKVNITWSVDHGVWTLQTGGWTNWTFGSGVGARHTEMPELDGEQDPYVALAAAIKAVDAERWR